MHSFIILNCIRLILSYRCIKYLLGFTYTGYTSFSSGFGRRTITTPNTCGLRNWPFVVSLVILYKQLPHYLLSNKNLNQLSSELIETLELLSCIVNGIHIDDDIHNHGHHLTAQTSNSANIYFFLFAFVCDNISISFKRCFRRVLH